MLHHTTKSVFGGNAVMASSGSAAIPAAFDQTILMNWLKQNAEQSTQSDKRMLFLVWVEVQVLHCC